MPTNCIWTLPHALSKYLLGRKYLALSWTKDKLVRALEPRPSFLLLRAPELKIWDPLSQLTRSSNIRQTLQKEDRQDKPHRPDARLTDTVATGSSVALEDLGTASKTSGISLGGAGGGVKVCSIGVCQWLKGWPKSKTIAKAQRTLQKKSPLFFREASPCKDYCSSQNPSTRNLGILGLLLIYL